MNDYLDEGASDAAFIRDFFGGIGVIAALGVVGFYVCTVLL